MNLSVSAHVRLPRGPRFTPTEPVLLKSPQIKSAQDHLVGNRPSELIKRFFVAGSGCPVFR